MRKQCRANKKQFLLLSHKFDLSISDIQQQGEAVMKLIKLLAFAAVIIIAMQSYTSPSQTGSFTLGANLITNYNISTPIISPASKIAYGLAQAGWTTTGSHVQYVNPCLESGLFVCGTFNGVTCGWQFLDSDSGSSNEQYYQTFNLAAVSEYQLQFDWISETALLLFVNGITVKWNNVVIGSVSDLSCTLHTATYYIMSIAGANTVSFSGTGLTDGLGILIRNIILSQLIYASTPNVTPNSTIPPVPTNTTTPNNTTSSNTSSNTSNPSNASVISFNDLRFILNGSEYQSLFEFIDFMENNVFLQKISSFSPSKQNFKFLVGFILEFNHFLLYNYHRLNNTVMSNIILAGMMAIDDQKGDIIDQYIYPALGTSPNDIVGDFAMQNDLASCISGIAPNLVQRPDGILLELTDAFILDLPITICFFVLGLILFRILFNFRISLLFRQYSLLGLFFYIFLDGKIQTLTFYFLSEVLLLTNFSFSQKMKTVAIIVCYFFLFVAAVALMFVYRSFYKRLLKYVYDNCQQPLSASYYMSFSFGLYNIVLGFMHRLLLPFPLLQLYILIAFETLYLISMFYLLLLRFYENTLLALTLCLMNVARIGFLISCLLFEFFPDSEYSIGLAQQYLFYSFVILWALSSVICFSEKIAIVFKAVTHSCKKNKVHPIYLDSSHENEGRLQVRKITIAAQKPLRLKTITQHQIDLQIKSRKQINIKTERQWQFQPPSDLEDMPSSLELRKRRPMDSHQNRRVKFK